MPVCLCKKSFVPVQRKLSLLLPLLLLILFALQTGTVFADDSCGSGCTWSFNASTGTLTISGTGQMDDYDEEGYNKPPWNGLIASITSLKVNGVKNIGDEAFFNFTALVSVSIGPSVTTIGNYAFYGCSLLSSVTFEGTSSLETIDDFAFRYCSSLTEFTIPASVTSIGDNPFAGCSDLGSITVAEGNTVYKSVDDVLFSRNGDALYALLSFPGGKGDSYAIPAGVEQIGRNAFSGCSGLTSLIIPDSLRSISFYAFDKCSGLTSVTVLPKDLPRLNSIPVFYAAPRGCKFYYRTASYLTDYWWSFDSDRFSRTVISTVTADPGITFSSEPAKRTYYGVDYYEAGSTITLNFPAGYTLETVAYNGTAIDPVGGIYSFTMPAEDVKLSASFTPITYTLAYELNDGALPQGVSNPESYTVESKTIILNDPVKEGHLFGGWYETADCSGSPVTQIPSRSTGDRTFYAKWIPNIYTVTFDANGGTGSMEGQSFTHGVPQALRPHDPQTFYRSGYGFEGWNTDPDGKGTHYDDGETITVTEDLTLYARWEAGIHTVTFIANGGEGHMGYEKFAYGSTQQLKPNTFTRTGYEFSGWNTKADGSGTGYADGQTVNITGDLTLHAQWTPLKYTVQFDANGGTGSMPDQTFTHDEPQALNVHQFKFEGFGFDSWNTKKDGSGTKYHDGEKITVTGDMMLYAQWDADMHTVTFIANGGTGHMDAEQFPFGSAQALTPNAFTREGFTFTGWNTEADGSGTAYADGQTVNISGDLTLYAQWAAGRYTVQFDANGGTGSMQPQSFELGQEQALTRCSFSREGFLFLGWNALPDGSGTNFSDGEVVRNLSDEDEGIVTLYAQWTDKATHVITFDANDGSGRTNQQKAEDSVKTRLTPNEFYRDGYRFIEWNTEADGSGTAYADEAYVSLTGNLTLYAQWKKDTGPEEEMELTVEFTSLVKGHRAVPPEIGSLTIAPVRIILSGGENRSVSEDISLTLTGGGEHTISLKVKFQKLPEEPAPGKYEVSVTGLPGTVYGREQIYMAEGAPEGDVLWKYYLTYAAEINRKGKEMIIRVWLIWDDGHRPDDDIAIYALPEDEIGAYVQYDDGTKEYLLFHTYAICMDWLGDDALCRGYERCFHKESPYEHPFVKP